MFYIWTGKRKQFLNNLKLKQQNEQMNKILTHQPIMFCGVPKLIGENLKVI
jgi:hypothetical protein